MTLNHARTRQLDQEERQWLLRLARSTIEARLEGQGLPQADPSPGPLTELRGAFVTLTDAGDLRGCIGHVVGAEPLWRSVRSNAINAAFNDPRFSPVTSGELGGLTVEVSALSPLWPLTDPHDIVIGRDGLFVELGSARGLLLPQVAKRYGWTPSQFLDQTCRKAGLEPGCWHAPDARVSAFSAEVFSEEDEPSD
jgi:AmmeMemoRadiSam system protein A